MLIGPTAELCIFIAARNFAILFGHVEQSVRGHSQVSKRQICVFYSVNAIDDIALELLLVGAVGGDGRLCLL